MRNQDWKSSHSGLVHYKTSCCVPIHWRSIYKREFYYPSISIKFNSTESCSTVFVRMLLGISSIFFCNFRLKLEIQYGWSLWSNMFPLPIKITGICTMCCKIIMKFLHDYFNVNAWPPEKIWDCDRYRCIKKIKHDKNHKNVKDAIWRWNIEKM